MPDGLRRDSGSSRRERSLRCETRRCRQQMGPHLLRTEPEAGVDCDLRQVLQAMWWRRSEQAVDAPWVDRSRSTSCAAGSVWRSRRCTLRVVRCLHVGHREVEGGRLTRVLVGQYGVVGCLAAGALATRGETATEAAAARRVCSAVSCSAAVCGLGLSGASLHVAQACQRLGQRGQVRQQRQQLAGLGSLDQPGPAQAARGTASGAAVRGGWHGAAVQVAGRGRRSRRRRAAARRACARRAS
jgi:hypothetical protein